MAVSKLEYDTAKSCIDKFNRIYLEMTDTFNALKTEMESLENDLKSRGGELLYNDYKSLEPKLDEVPKKVDEFKRFLELAIAEYEEEDQILQNQVRR